MEELMKKHSLNTVSYALIVILVFVLSSCSNVVSHWHTFSEEWAYNGKYHWHNSTCEHHKEVLAKEVHKFNGWEVEDVDELNAVVIVVNKCSVCNYKQERQEIAVHSHSLGKKHNAVAATCAKSGSVEYYDCENSTCNVKLNKYGVVLDDVVVEPTDHVESSEMEIKTKPTCSDTGSAVYRCSVCYKVLRTVTIPAEHSFGVFISNNDATTEADGTKSRICSVCDFVETVIDVGTKKCVHRWTAKIDEEADCIKTVCSECFITESVKLYSSPSGSGPVLFGVFPKRILRQSSDVTVDENVSVTMGPNTYYRGSDSNYYAKVTTVNKYNSNRQYTDGSLVKDGVVRYFQLEPIEWFVLKYNYNGSSKSLIVAKNPLTSNVPYYENIEERLINGKTVYPNNYKYSTIRAYLNGSYEKDDTQTIKYEGTGFLQTAFLKSGQKLIATTIVDNSDSESYGCESTYDKIFLISKNEFDEIKDHYELYNVIEVPDFARANNASLNSYYSSCYGDWWLRSPYDKKMDLAYCIHEYWKKTSYTSGVDVADYVYETVSAADICVVPALCISLK